MKHQLELAQNVTSSVRDALGNCDQDLFSYALAKIDEYILGTTGRDNGHYAKSRRALVPVRNTINGIIESTSSRQMQRVIAQYGNNAEQNLQNFSELFAEAQRSESARRGVVDSMRFDDTQEISRAIRQALKDKADMDMLAHYANVIKKLPRKIKEGFEIVRVPILPTFEKSFKMEEAFVRAKILYDKIDIYYILKNQFVLAVNSSLHSDKSEQLDYIKNCLDTVNESGNVQYSLVTTKLCRHPTSSNTVIFAWLMENRKFQTLVTAAGSFNIKIWSFPTQS